MSTKTSKKRPINKGSTLLTPNENEALFRLLGYDNYTLATGVVQLLAADIPGSREWQKKLVGVICFIKDYNERGYYLRLYDIIKNCITWEQKLYDGFCVKQKTEECAPELVTFEGDRFVYGLNFSSKDEATYFTAQITKRLEQEQYRKYEGASPVVSSVTTPQQAKRTSGSEQMSSNNAAFSSPNNNNNNITPHVKPSKKRKNKITKNDIGFPTNFEHRLHIGWNPDVGITRQAIDKELDSSLLQLLDTMGIKIQELRKRDLRAVYQIVEQYGGIDAVKTELKQRTDGSTAPNPPAPKMPAPSSVGQIAAPAAAPTPPPKVRDLSAATGARTATSSVRPGPPPPPPMPPVIVGSAAPPPPPPPPPSLLSPLAPADTGAAVAAPVPPPPPSADGRADLMAQISRGTTLKPVTPTDADAKSSTPVRGRDAMLKDIKEGVVLRPVDKQEKQRITPPEDMGGIAGALARALQERRFQISDETDSDDDNENEEGEWED